MRDALLALLQPAPDWYAARLKAAFKGWGAQHRISTFSRVGRLAFRFSFLGFEKMELVD